MRLARLVLVRRTCHRMIAVVVIIIVVRRNVTGKADARSESR